MQRSIVHLRREADSQALVQLIREAGGKVDRVIPGFAIMAFLPEQARALLCAQDEVLSVRQEHGFQLPPADEAVPQ